MVPGGGFYSLSSMGMEGTGAMSRGRPSVAEALQAHASVICLQRPSLPTARLNNLNLNLNLKKVSTTARLVSRRKSDIEETSKQKKL